jgi:hypothetical protein
MWVNKFKLYCKEALAALADLWLAAGLLDSEVVRRHRMLRDYRAHCADKFKLYCKESGDGLAMAAVDGFLAAGRVEGPRLEEAQAALADLWPAAGLLDSEVVRRHRMLRDYRAHCAGQGAAPASLPGMQAVILLSQLLARPAAQAVDLHWVLGAAGRLGPGQGDLRLIEDFFLSVRSPLPTAAEEDTAAGAEEAARVVAEFKALRLCRGLSQRAAAAEVRKGGGPAAAELLM